MQVIFESAVARGSTEHHHEQGLCLQQFVLQLLSPANDAVEPAREPSATEHLREPLSHYWTACSHNTYIVGDQLTGLSSAAMYRRQLLQVLASRFPPS